MIFNYKMTPSYETEVRGHRRIRHFYKDIHNYLEVFEVDYYIFNSPYAFFINEGDNEIHFKKDVSLEYVINYYSKMLGLFSNNFLCVNDVPNGVEYDYRSMNKEICLDYDLLL